MSELKVLKTAKAPVRYLREFFCYSAFFKNLVQNVPQTFKISTQGNSAFEWHKTVGCYIASASAPVANNALMIPDLTISFKVIGSDKSFFNNNTLNAMEITKPAGIALSNATPIVFAGRSVIVVTVTSAYTTTIPFFNLTLTGNHLYAKLPPAPQAPMLVTVAK
jgi:hypothetical protein